MQNLVGVLWLMAELPGWVIFIGLYVICIGILPIGRMYFEGMPYNISYASSVGDVFLFGIVLIGADILKNYTGPSVMGWNFQAVLAVVCVAISLLSWRFLPADMVMDRYHSVVIVPLLFFLLVVSVVTIKNQAVSYQKVTAIVFFLVWLGFLIWDIKSGQLEQKKWLTIRNLYPQ